MDLYSQPTWPNMQKLYTKQKFIYWATRGRLNNHCNNNGLLGMKQQKVATGFLHTSATLQDNHFRGELAPLLDFVEQFLNDAKAVKLLI